MVQFAKRLAPAVLSFGVCYLSFFLGYASANGSVEGCPLIAPPSAFFPSIRSAGSSSVTPKVLAALETIVTSYVANYSIPYYAVSVVHENHTIFTSGLATAPFMVGSITKTFTALGALILRERGLLSLDDPVKKFLPNFSIINPYDSSDITLRQLMGHVSGMPRELCENLYVAGQSEQQCPVEESNVLAAVAKMELARPPWSREPAYSNLGFALLGHAWEKATSPPMSWDEFLVEEIFKPLGLHRTGTSLTNVMLADNSSAEDYDVGWIGPAGNVYSTATDLAKYLIFLLKASPGLISASAIREWTNSRTIFPDGNGGFALPWELVKINATGNEFLITKGGATGGATGAHLTIIAIHPPTQLGISVLFALNLSYIASPTGLMAEILNVLIPTVETENAEIIDAVYAGHYVCKATPPTFSQPFNVTVETLGGFFNITGSSKLGLSAFINVSAIINGEYYPQIGTQAMLLKNASENSFWLGTGTTCLEFFGGISGLPSITDPNDPGTDYGLEILFDSTNGTLRWPALGSVCVKQLETAPRILDVASDFISFAGLANPYSQREHRRASDFISLAR